MPHRVGPSGFTPMEESLFRQNERLAAQNRSTVEASAAMVARTQAAGSIGFGGSYPGISSVAAREMGLDLIWISADGHFMSGGEWVGPEEYQRRSEKINKFVYPRRASNPDEVITGIARDGSVICDCPGGYETVRKREFFRRFRKWRRRGDIGRRRYEDMIIRIEAITGWRCGADFWLLRLLGFGPRPR